MAATIQDHVGHFIGVLPSVCLKKCGKGVVRTAHAAPTLTSDAPSVLKVAKVATLRGTRKMNTRIIGIVIGLVLIAGVVAADVLLLWP